MVELSYSSESEDLPLVVVGDVVGVVPSKNSRKILRLVRTYGVSSEAKAHELVGNHDEAVVGRDDVLVGRGDTGSSLLSKLSILYQLIAPAPSTPIAAPRQSLRGSLLHLVFTDTLKTK